MSSALIRDCVGLLALGLIFGGCAALFGPAVASLVLGVLLLLIALRAGVQRSEK